MSEAKSRRMPGNQELPTKVGKRSESARRTGACREAKSSRPYREAKRNPVPEVLKINNQNVLVRRIGGKIDRIKQNQADTYTI